MLPEEKRCILQVLWNSQHPCQFKDERPKAATLHLGILYVICSYFLYFLWRPSQKIRKQSQESLSWGKAVLSPPCTWHAAWYSAPLPALSHAKLHVKFPGVVRFYFGILAFLQLPLILRENELRKMDSFFFFFFLLLFGSVVTAVAGCFWERGTLGAKCRARRLHLETVLPKRNGFLFFKRDLKQGTPVWDPDGGADKLFQQETSGCWDTRFSCQIFRRFVPALQAARRWEHQPPIPPLLRLHCGSSSFAGCFAYRLSDTATFLH